ncbi:MAG: hypothetical protein U0360_07325 [Dehalococcoidia bacterium]
MTTESGRYASMSEVELREEARERGLTVDDAATREELLRRLEEDSETEGAHVRGSGIIGGTDGYGTGVPALDAQGRTAAADKTAGDEATSATRQ